MAEKKLRRFKVTAKVVAKATIEIVADSEAEAVLAAEHADLSEWTEVYGKHCSDLEVLER